MVLHLREQLKELQTIKEALAVSKLREETLQNQVNQFFLCVNVYFTTVYIHFHVILT